MLSKDLILMLTVRRYFIMAAIGGFILSFTLAVLQLGEVLELPWLIITAPIWGVIGPVLFIGVVVMLGALLLDGSRFIVRAIRRFIRGRTVR